jgi:D-2-hydroxyacid dehydrogenase (NADP+)
MTTVLILDEHAQDYCERLVSAFPSVTFHAVEEADQARDVLADADVIIALAHRVSRETIARARALKWIQALTTGTDALTAPGVLPARILLTSTRGVHGPQMSELAFLNMLALNRRFLDMRRSQAAATWDRHPQPLLEGKTVVIVGLGVLAEHLAERCKLFGMRVIGVSSGRTSAPHFDEVMPRTELTKAAARADFLVLLVPYAPATRHLVDRAVLDAMKPTAFLINLARGGVLDEDALADHLKAGKIAGAGLDIFQTQPLPADSPFWTMPNVIVTPNVGGHSDVFVQQTLAIVEPNLTAFIEGRLGDLRNLVAH